MEKESRIRKLRENSVRKKVTWESRESWDRNLSEKLKWKWFEKIEKKIKRESGKRQ